MGDNRISTKYIVQNNGVLDTQGGGMNLFPGSVAGVPQPPATSNGGIYLP